MCTEERDSRWFRSGRGCSLWELGVGEGSLEVWHWRAVDPVDP